MSSSMLRMWFAATTLAATVHAQDPAPEAAPPQAAVDLSLLADMKARAIGPAVCSGRVAAVAGVPGDPSTIWVGASAGGVWRSRDGGVTFDAVFDDQDVASIGAIAIWPRSPEVVWVGSGEGNPRNSASVGRGIYRTRDGGRTWDKLGLEQTERIHRIVLHPSDPDTAWVAAFGTSWGENEQRGVFKTTDGGDSWRKVLYVDERTGCGDLVADPHNPDKLFANMWQHRRWPWSFQSGGPGSGLYRSLDGGESWQQLDHDDGLPEGELGRIGLAIAHDDPDVVYALVEAKKSVLLRSDDGGYRFRAVNSKPGVAPRPFYFCDIRVDPDDANRIYNMHTVVDVSTDGGRSFETLVGWNAAHPDHHAMWIDPQDPERILIGNDGGVYTSQDRGATWRFCRNLPLAQFYHVAVDHDVPYHIYGGLQDNGSWRGPSNVWENGGIRNLHWQEVCFGDGFATVPDPDDSMQGYAMSQGGNLVRWDLRTGSQRSIRPPAPDEETELRFHWNAAIAIDPFAAGTVYYGSQFVHKSEDRGGRWQLISPDLTTDNPEWQKQDESGGLTIDVTDAENHCTILTIAPSPKLRGVMWVGTDDGRVHVTRDGGESWRSVEHNIPELPAHTWCPHIEASPFDAATAFAVFDDHRRANWTPYVYVTRDYGASWTSLANDDIDGYCHVVEADPVQPDLLWVGTEFGLFVSLDGGASWQKWTHGVPTCAVRALITQPRDGDLVVGTHGRSVFVLDDISPLRTLDPELLSATLHVFEPRPAIQHAVAQSPSTRFPGAGEFRAPTLPRGVVLQVLANADELEHPDPEVQAQREAADAAKDDGEDTENDEADNAADDDEGDDDVPPDTAVLEVRDANGKLLRTFRHKLHLGLNRIVWRFERDGSPGPMRKPYEAPDVAPAGRAVLPGRYRLTVQFHGESRSVDVDVLPDPRTAVATKDREAKDALLAEREALELRLHEATQRLAPVAGRLDVVRARLSLEQQPDTGDDPLQPLRDALKQIDERLEATQTKIWGETRDVQGIRRADDGLIRKIRRLARIDGSPLAPTATERDGLARATAHAPDVERAVEQFLSEDLATFEQAVATSGLGLLQVTR